MATLKNSRVLRIAPLLIVVCYISIPVYAKYSGGTGEPNDPYQIATAEDLMLLGETPEDYDKHFILTADIDLDPSLPGRKVLDRAVISPDLNDNEYDFQGSAFTGTFDGYGHAIYHLTIVGRSYVGLFGQLGSFALVKNLGVLHADITGGMLSGDWCVGGLVGKNLASITSSYCTGTITGNEDVGGLVGMNVGSVTASCSEAAVNGYRSVGGLLGSNYIGDVSNCYSTGNVSGDRYVGGLVGKNGGINIVSRITSCYSTGSVNGERGVGGLVGGGSAAHIANSFWDVETSGRESSTGGTGLATAQMKDAATFLFWGTCGNEGIWTVDDQRDYPRLWWQNKPGEPISVGGTLSDFLRGEGTKENPYLIDTAEEFVIVGLFPCDYDKHFVLTSDIDLDPNLPGRKVFDRAVIGGHTGSPFAGIFDANGHTISHLAIQGGANLGLFGQLASGAEIKNVGVVDVNIVGSGNHVGGLVGLNAGSVNGSYSIGTVVGNLGVGGLVGRNFGSIGSSRSIVRASGNGNVGGLVGSNEGSVTTSHSSGTVMGVSSVGGLAGWNYGSITASYSNDTVTGNARTGGLVGRNWGSVVESYSTGAVSGDRFVGGFAGENYRGYAPDGDGNITMSYSIGKVSGDQNVGGFVGYTWGDAITTASFWDIDASRQTVSAGGTGLTTFEMQTGSTFLEAGWDFVDETTNGIEDIWWILEGQNYPRLWWEAE